LSEADDQALAAFLRGRRVFVSGVCGTVGRALLERLLAFDVAAVVGTDHNEGGLFELGRAIDDERVSLLLGAVQDRQQLAERFRGVDIVFHGAGFKHVGTCERSPRDAVSVNVVGTQNVIDAARAAGVERVLFMSSDKAVNPTSVMGASKLLSERLVTAAAGGTGEATVFASTRFGNVLGSSGSVVPVFAGQIAAGGPITLTDERMNRFVMTPAEAIDLVLESVRLADGGEIVVPKMHAVRIVDLANVLIDRLATRFGWEPDAIRIDTVGTLPGEKLYEELVSGEEAARTLELDGFYVILPALVAGAMERLTQHYGKAPASEQQGAYRSDSVEPLGRAELGEYMDNPGVIEAGRRAVMPCAF
jgi:FlaA1/EpsC-like NDP-sugar epimerase